MNKIIYSEEPHIEPVHKESKLKTTCLICGKRVFHTKYKRHIKTHSLKEIVTSTNV